MVIKHANYKAMLHFTLSKDGEKMVDKFRKRKRKRYLKVQCMYNIIHDKRVRGAYVHVKKHMVQ